MAKRLALEKWHGEARLAGGTDPGIENFDNPRMRDRAKRGHLMRETIAKPAVLSCGTAQDLHGYGPFGAVKIGGLVDDGESAARKDAVEKITSVQNFAGPIVRDRIGGSAMKSPPQEKSRFLDLESSFRESRFPQREGSDERGGREPPNPGGPGQGRADAERVDGNGRPPCIGDFERVAALGEIAKFERSVGRRLPIL